MSLIDLDNIQRLLNSFYNKIEKEFAAKSHGTHLTLGTTSNTAFRGDYGNTAYNHSQAAHAPSNAQKNSDITKAEIEAKLTGAITSHTHSYAGSSSAGGAATSANKVNTSLIIKLNGGTTEGTNLFTFNGSAAKTVNITPSAIGAAASSHGTHLTIGTGASNAAAGNHSHTLFTRNTVGDIGWNTSSNQGLPVAVSAIAYWNGAYSGTTSNLAYCAKGAFGSIVTKNSGDYAPYGHTHTQLPGEVMFPGSGTYSDPWNGTECAIKATGNIGCTGGLRANGGVATCASPNGVATADGSKYVANFNYSQSRGICDLGNNGIPGRLYIRSGQGTAGSGVYVECQVTNGYAYMQYLSPEAGTIALTSHLSDRTRKDNIVYIDSEESKFTTKDFYDFIKDDLGLATYTLKEDYSSTDTHTKLNFIAQDILWDYNKNEEHKVGNLIVQAASAMEEQLSLKFDPDNYVSVIAGALKESINKIEELEAKNKILEELVYSMNERLLKIENCSKEE